jgi:hypothetical protein
MNDTTALYSTIDEFLTSISQVRLVDAASVVDFCLDLRQIVSSPLPEVGEDLDFVGV